MQQYLKIKNATISTPLLDIIKETKSVLYNGKLKTIRPMGDNIRVTCPFHKNGLENKASADVYIGNPKENLEYGWFKCFTCGHTGSFYNFIAGCFNISEDKAKEWLIENFADDIDATEILDLPEIELTKKPKNIPLNETILKNFEDFHPYLIKRKIAKRIIDLFEIKYDPKTQCVVFPVRDENGKLVMLTRRSVIDKKFMIDKDKEKPLYLLYYMLQHNIQSVMITEGQIDSLTAITYGFPCIATMGAISQHQIDTLNKSGIRVLYTMFDADIAGKSFTDKLIRGLRKDILVINVPINIPGKKDINDLSAEEFYHCIELAEKNSNLN